MTGAWRAFRAALTDEAPAPPPRPEPRGCAECGALFIGSAFGVHREDLGGGRARCMPATRLEGSLLTLVDGAWVLSGSDSATR